MKKKLSLKMNSAFLLSSIYLLLFSAYAQPCLAPLQYEELDVNNIRALFKTNGSLFNRFDSPEFEVPKYHNKTTIFAASLWLGGLDEEDNLHLAAMRYGSNGNDYWAGPISNAGEEAGTYYDKIWTITKSQIDYHKAHFQNPEYATNMPESIIKWPAHGRTEYGESTNLAPYKSVSGYSKYTPTKGDFPLIRGDKALFWMNNDVCNTHTETGGEPLGMEIMNMAYAYNSEDYALKHTIFLSCEIRNKSTNNYKDFYVGFFVDFDIGYGWDDYVGCDSLLNLAYGYNGNEIDEGSPFAYGIHPPAQGAMFLNKKMDAFIYYNNSHPGPFGDPDEAAQYYNYLRAIWKDGRPLTFGGNGYNYDSNHYTKFAFSGDPVTKTGWSEILPNGPGFKPNTPGDRRGVMSAGPFTFLAGGTICIDIALPYARDTQGDNTTAVALLKQNAQTIQQFYNNQNYEDRCSGTIAVIDNKSKYDKIQIYPNPSNGQFVVSSDKIIEKIELFDVFGRKVFSDVPKTQTTQINTPLPEGLYIYRAMLQDKSICSGKISVTKP